MGIHNYNSFALVSGFMLGAIVSVIRFDNVVLMVSSAILISVLTYSLTMFASSHFVRYYQFEKMFFAKGDYEDVLSYFRHEIDSKESILDDINAMYEDITFDDESKEAKNSVNPAKSKEYE
jgi:hypothetical protein